MAVVITLLGFNAGQSYRALQTLIKGESRTSSTQSILRTIKDFYSLIQDMELGVRAYFITGDEAFLVPYVESLDEIKSSLLLLKGYEYQTTGQLQRVEQLEEMLVTHLIEINSYIKPGNQVNQDNPPPLISDYLKENYRWIQDFSARVNEMETLEYNVLATQSRESAASRESVFYTLVVATAVGVLLVILIGWLVHAAILYQQQETQRLEAMVADRTQGLRHFSRELQRSNRELQDFAFVASHDLQEPLRKIRTFGDRLQISYAHQLGDGADYLERMQRAAERMSRLIADLLEFSRVSTSPNPFESVNLGDALDDVLDNLELKINETGARIEIEPLPTIEADAFQMRQLMQNLILNSIKFVREGTSPKIRISNRALSNTTEAEQFQLQFSDNGIGIDPRYVDKIFTPFQRLHGRDQYEGTGIGLAICRRIVERHGGRIDVSSELGCGTTFLVTLPATQKYRLEQTDTEDAEA